MGTKKMSSFSIKPCNPYAKKAAPKAEDESDMGYIYNEQKEEKRVVRNPSDGHAIHIVNCTGNTTMPQPMHPDMH